MTPSPFGASIGKGGLLVSAAEHTGGFCQDRSDGPGRSRTCESSEAALDSISIVMSTASTTPSPLPVIGTTAPAQNATANAANASAADSWTLRDADEPKRCEQNHVGEEEVRGDTDRTELPTFAQGNERLLAQGAGALRPVVDRVALALHTDPRKRPLRFRSQPAGGRLPPEEEPSGHAGGCRDGQREDGRYENRPIGVAGDQQHEQRDKRQ